MKHFEIITVMSFWTLSISVLYILNATFLKLDSVFDFRQTPTHMGKIDRASPYLRT
jgi:hypothetical protein